MVGGTQQLPGWESWAKPLPFPLDPKNPCIVSTIFEGLQTRPWVLDGFCRMLFAQQQERKLWGQFSFSYKLLQGKLPLRQFSQPWKWVGSPAPSQLCAKIGKNTQLEPHEGKINYLFIFLIFVANEFKVRYQLDGFSFDSWRHYTHLCFSELKKDFKWQIISFQALPGDSWRELILETEASLWWLLPSFCNASRLSKGVNSYCL